MGERENVKPIIESLLFVHEKPLTVEKIEEIIPGLDKEKIVETISELMEEYNDMEHKGLQVIEIANGYQMCTKKPYEQYHVYAIEWYEDRIDFFLDDQKYFTFENEGTGDDVWPFDKPHYLILNAAIGGSWGGQKGIDDTIFPQKYHIDYVRVYKRAGR